MIPLRCGVGVLAVWCLAGGFAAAQTKKVDFQTEILPGLRLHCFSCHGDPTPKTRAKGGLRLDGADWIRKGGDLGPAIVSGDAKASELHLRIALPPTHEDRMPPKGSRPDAAFVDRVARWIEQGASFGTWTGKSGRGVERKKPVSSGVSPRMALWLRLARDLKPATTSELSRTSDFALISPVVTSLPLLRVGFHSREADVTNATIQGLSPIRKHIVALDLRRCDKITDAALAACGQMPRLTRLDLGETSISDSGLNRLTPLRELRYLNLYGTRVTDGGLETLAKLPSLVSVYLWQAKTTKGGARRLERRLKERNPRARVVRDPGLPKVPNSR